ncbi:MAG: thymidine phosphorylase [Fimbriimonadaceae bacterium]|nr:MAG: thymidine phosphorylase [Fimbriimonadaceae bacterium]
MNILDLIAKKRDNGILSAEELAFIANGAADQSIPDYQLAAWLMATYLNGLDDQETADLTLAMADSGERIDLAGLPKPWVDKHSTGGVGDKTTIVLLPILAACGLTVVKMSGPGLGKTGGTIDKLASVPGFNTNLSPEQMKAQAKEIGLALTGQTPSLAPADKTLYALRDVTATVPCLPLIVSSILSKKIAGGADVVVLDVKCGSGAFMETLDDASRLASKLREVGEKAGLTMRTVITDMDQPLGRTAGNALEIKEAIQILKNKETSRFSELCIQLAKTALEAAGVVADPAFAIASGAALIKAKQWFAAQGADISVFDNEDWQVAPVQLEVFATESGFVKSISADIIGETVVDLGGGRRIKTDTIDPTVGIETLVHIGDKVDQGQPIFRIHASTEESAANASEKLALAVKLSTTEVIARPILMGSSQPEFKL